MDERKNDSNLVRLVKLNILFYFCIVLIVRRKRHTYFLALALECDSFSMLTSTFSTIFANLLNFLIDGFNFNETFCCFSQLIVFQAAKVNLIDCRILTNDLCKMKFMWKIRKNFMRQNCISYWPSCTASKDLWQTMRVSTSAIFINLSTLRRPISARYFVGENGFFFWSPSFSIDIKIFT